MSRNISFTKALGLSRSTLLGLTIYLSTFSSVTLAQETIESANQTPLRDMIREEVERAIDDHDHDGPFKLSFSGYGDIRFAYYDYPETITQSEGSRGQSRVGFDTTRFTFELEGEHRASGIEFEAEIEFEHGGTGSAVELEQDEFGEFESEVEKGGEVLLEELYLQKDFGHGFSAKAGRFYVALGLLSNYYRPTDYLASGRSEAETTVLPAVWDEIGFELQKQFQFGRATLQLVSGLDSTGFSASRWVADGHQQRFESIRAEDPAFVFRFDYTEIPGVLVGSSIYYTPSTTGNRPKDDLDVDGSVVIGDAHFRAELDNWLAQGTVILGWLSDAQEISERNARLSNELGVERTPIADQALGLWAELGYNMAPLFHIPDGHEIHPYFRFDYYDTYFDTRDELIDNPRLERTVYTAGVAYTYDRLVVTKLDVTRREFGNNEVEAQNMIRLGIGFIY